MGDSGAEADNGRTVTPHRPTHQRTLTPKRSMVSALQSAEGEMRAFEDQRLRADEAQSAMPERRLFRSGTPSHRISSSQREYPFKLSLSNGPAVGRCACGAQLTRPIDTLTSLVAGSTDSLGFRVGHTFLLIGFVAAWLLALESFDLLHYALDLQPGWWSA